MRRSIPWLLVLLAVAVTAGAQESDLQQAISDLGSQASDKERMDQHSAAKVELSEIRSWLGEATNAVREEREPQARRLLERVRVQLRLVDELITLAKLEDQTKKLEQAVAAAAQSVSGAKRKLEHKQAQLRALKMRQAEEQ